MTDEQQLWLEWQCRSEADVPKQHGERLDAVAELYDDYGRIVAWGFERCGKHFVLRLVFEEAIVTVSHKWAAGRFEVTRLTRPEDLT